MKIIQKADLSIVAVFLMDLIKGDTLTVEVGVKGAEKKSFKNHQVDRVRHQLLRHVGKKI